MQLPLLPPTTSLIAAPAEYGAEPAVAPARAPIEATIGEATLVPPNTNQLPPEPEP